MKIAIVAPAYNEEKIIDKFIKNVSKVEYPVYIIDDGSDDKTYDVLSKSKIKNKKSIILKHRINLGKGAAMKTGAEAAFSDGFDAVIFMDTDGQHDINDLPKFVDKLEEGYDIVFGSRNMGLGVPLIRYMGNKLVSLSLSFLYGIYVSDILCGYRAVTKKAYKQIEWESANYAVETEMVVRTAKTTLRHCEVPVATLYLDATKDVPIMDAAGKNVTIADAIGIFIDILRWKVKM